MQWTHTPVDHSGAAIYGHLIRSPDDPERTPRPKGGRKDRVPHLSLRRKGRETVDAWRTSILEHLDDDEPRTFNRLCVEIGDLTADIAFQEAPDVALWELVAEGELEHTTEAPIFFRRRRHTCERCNERLKRKPVWLELNSRTGEWVRAGKASWSDGPDSQGGFPFGAACARRTLKTQNAYDLK